MPNKKLEVIYSVQVSGSGTGPDDAVYRTAVNVIGLSPDWWIQVVIEAQDGRPVARELIIRPADPDAQKPAPSGLTTTLLRGIHIEKAIAAAFRDVGIMHRALGDSIFDHAGFFHGLGYDARMFSGEESKGRGKSELFYALLAAEFVEALKKDPHSPYKVLAKMRDLDPTEPGVIDRLKDWRRKAVKKGLLTSSDEESGKTGGRLTPRCISILQAAGAVRKGEP